MHECRGVGCDSFPRCTAVSHAGNDGTVAPNVWGMALNKDPVQSLIERRDSELKIEGLAKARLTRKALAGYCIE